jgi:hypothetical protein
VKSPKLLLGFFYFWNMKEKNEFELVVSPGRRPIWKTILAALFFTVMVYSIYEIIYMYWNLGICEYTSKYLPKFTELIAYSLSGGVAFSVMKSVLIDVDKDKLISRFYIGPFSRDVLSTVPELEYVSVFLNQRDCFEVNLWYKGNKHYKMYAFDEELGAFEFATQVANKLNIDLLDATEKGNSKWIDKTNS